MNYTTHHFTTHDQEQLFYYHWKHNAPKGVIQIAHGLGEHAGRYIRIAQTLYENGYEVYANDHRIHGKSVGSKEHRGVYKGRNYFDDAVADMHVFSRVILKDHPKKKIILLSHSMGSLLGRQYAIENGDILLGMVLSGTGSFLKGIGDIGLFVARTIKLFKGRKRYSGLLKTLFFGEFNKKFKPNRTKVDWISSDPSEVDAFDQDPLRIENFSISMYIDILKGSKKVNQPKTFHATPNALPIYIFSGDQDPVGEMGKGVKKVADQYSHYGSEDLTLKLYTDGRHEMLNEVNKNEVEKDLLQWLDALVQKTT